MLKIVTDYYVYVHRRLSDNLPFYVGKGIKNRATVFHGRNSHWQRVKEKHGVKVEIVFDNLSEEEAYQCEIDTILEFEYFGYPLTNKTKGGKGVSGLTGKKQQREAGTYSHNKTLYTFVSLSGEVVSNITRLAFVRLKNIDRVTFSQLFNRKLNLQNSCGWGILLPNETIEDCVKRITKNRSRSKSSKKIYTFQHSSGIEFTGTRFELSLKYSLDMNRLCELFGNKTRKRVLGWTLVKEH